MILMNTIRVKKLHPNAVLPTYGSAEAAGADLYACLEEAVTIQPGLWPHGERMRNILYPTIICQTSSVMALPSGNCMNWMVLFC